MPGVTDWSPFPHAQALTWCQQLRSPRSRTDPIRLLLSHMQEISELHKTHSVKKHTDVQLRSCKYCGRTLQNVSGAFYIVSDSSDCNVTRLTLIKYSEMSGKDSNDFLLHCRIARHLGTSSTLKGSSVCFCSSLVWCRTLKQCASLSERVPSWVGTLTCLKDPWGIISKHAYKEKGSIYKAQAFFVMFHCENR